jgi:N-acetylmuramic acid 6-phosphate etherase
LGTEARNPRTYHLSELDSAEVIALMDSEERVVFDALERARPLLATAADRIALTFESGGRTFLVGAGTSGRLAVGEAAEMPPTFGVADGVFIPIVAGSRFGGPSAVTKDEDDVAAAPAALDYHRCGPTDAVIGLAASGTTPFVLAATAHARKRGAWTCGIANNPGSTLLADVDVGILLDTGPEVLTGSTRLKAGTAQKLALNRITTAAMTKLGRVIENLMVEVQPANTKLRNRCAEIVSELTGAPRTDAHRMLDRTGWSIRAAVDELLRGRAGP